MRLFRSYLAPMRQLHIAHPDTYAATRNCLNKNGVWKVYQEPKPTDNTFHWLCQDPVTKTVYDMIVEKINETTYREKTAFMPKGGIWGKVFRWLSKAKASAAAHGKTHQPVPLNCFNHRSRLVFWHGREFTDILNGAENRFDLRILPLDR
jgi:hypothetical protein